MQSRRDVPGRRHFANLVTTCVHGSGGGGGHAVAIEERREQPAVHVARQCNVVR